MAPRKFDTNLVTSQIVEFPRGEGEGGGGGGGGVRGVRGRVRGGGVRGGGGGEGLRGKNVELARENLSN